VAEFRTKKVSFDVTYELFEGGEKGGTTVYSWADGLNSFGAIPEDLPRLK